MGETEADCATAVAGLHAMHVQVDVVSQPIDVLRFDKGHVVSAGCAQGVTRVNKVGSPSCNPVGCSREEHEVRCECRR